MKRNPLARLVRDTNVFRPSKIPNKKKPGRINAKKIMADSQGNLI